MPKALSVDLRTRVVSAIANGLSCRQAAIRGRLAAYHDVSWRFGDGSVNGAGAGYNPASQIMRWGASSTHYDYKELMASGQARTYNGLN
jgi:hypothetical protein